MSRSKERSKSMSWNNETKKK